MLQTYWSPLYPYARSKNMDAPNIKQYRESTETKLINPKVKASVKQQDRSNTQSYVNNPGDKNTRKNKHTAKTTTASKISFATPLKYVPSSLVKSF